MKIKAPSHRPSVVAVRGVIEETTCDEPSDEAAQRCERYSSLPIVQGAWTGHKGLKLDCVSGLSERRAARIGGGLTSTNIAAVLASLAGDR